MDGSGNLGDRWFGHKPTLSDQGRKILFMVEIGNSHYITHAHEREEAKRNAREWLGGDPERYSVMPLTSPGDRIKIGLVLYV